MTIATILHKHNSASSKKYNFLCTPTKPPEPQSNPLHFKSLLYLPTDNSPPATPVSYPPNLKPSAQTTHSPN